MATWLAHHPFAVKAILSRTTVITFAAPATEVQQLLPECLTVDTWENDWAFMAAALVQTRNLRPAGLPAWLGHNFFLIGYRIFVRYTARNGRRLRGLYILRSETDKRKMQWLGNVFTQYNYATIDLHQRATEQELAFHSNRTGLDIRVGFPATEPTLPVGSPFSTWQQARRFAGPLPFTFSYEAASQQVHIVEGEREFWQPQPVEIKQVHVPFFEELGLRDMRLASAFTMTDIEYNWKKGRAEQWHPQQ